MNFRIRASFVCLALAAFIPLAQAAEAPASASA